MAKQRKPLVVPWITDPLTEHDLDLSGLKYTFNPVLYSSIDVHGGLHNRAREITALSEEHWMDYALKMEAGHPFKCVVLFQLNDGVFEHGVAHGNHRLRAFAYAHNDDTKFLRSAKAMIGAYVVKSGYTDDIEEYERLANNREGWRQNREYAISNAIWLVNNRKLTLKRAEERTGISANQISKHIRGKETRTRIEKLGVDAHGINVGHLERLSSIKYDSNLKHMAELISEGNIGSQDFSKMVTQINRLRTEAKRNAYIHDEYNRTRRERGGPRSGAEPIEQRKRRLFLKAFRQFEDLWLKGNDGRPISSLSDIGIAPQDTIVRKEMASRARDLIQCMNKAMRLNGGKK